MIKSTIAVAALFVAGLAGTAEASEARIRQALQSKFPNMTVEGVTRAPFAGLYEVILDGEIVYTDEKTEYFLSGSIYDIRTMPPKNLTQERTNRIVANTLAGTQDLAVKRVKGTGKRVLYTFEDPNCGYCKELSKELAKVNNITVYTYLLPILSQDSVEKSRAIWCAKDRAKAWDDVMLKSVALPAAQCDAPVDRVRQLAQRFGVRGTPAIYLSNGQQIGGYVPAERIEQALNSGR